MHLVLYQMRTHCHIWRLDILKCTIQLVSFTHCTCLPLDAICLNVLLANGEQSKAIPVKDMVRDTVLMFTGLPDISEPTKSSSPPAASLPATTATDDATAAATTDGADTKQWWITHEYGSNGCYAIGGSTNRFTSTSSTSSNTGASCATATADASTATSSSSATATATATDGPTASDAAKQWPGWSKS